MTAVMDGGPRVAVRATTSSTKRLAPWTIVAQDGADDDGGTLYTLLDHAGKPVVCAAWPQPLEERALLEGRETVRGPSFTGSTAEIAETSRRSKVSELNDDELDQMFRDTYGEHAGNGHSATGLLEPPAEPEPEPRPRSGPKSAWTRERVIEAIRAFAESHDGRPPAQAEMTAANGLPANAGCRRLFGSFGAAVEAAGFPKPVKGGRHPTRRANVAKAAPKTVGETVTVPASALQHSQVELLAGRVAIAEEELRDASAVWQQKRAALSSALDQLDEAVAELRRAAA